MKKILQRANQVPYLNPVAYLIIGLAGFLTLIYGVYHVSECAFVRCATASQVYQGLLGFGAGIVGFGLALQRFFLRDQK